jgi:uncharacterized protein (TIGR03118 family)
VHCRIHLEDQLMAKRVLALVASLGLLVVLVVPATARDINSINAYVVHNLQSDVPGAAAQTDPDLVNGWGITASGTSPWWVADNGTAKSTLYNGNTGAKVTAVIVDIPGADGPGAPTGVVFNTSTDPTEFVIAGGGGTSAARFIFDGEDGTVSAWNGGAAAVITATSQNGAIYKGLAIGKVGTATYLFAADFHNAHVDVYNGAFALQDWGNAFVDPGIPAGFAPFGIQNIADQIFVTYAKQDADAEDEIAGDGLGYVSAFGTDGSFHGRIASRGALNAPWGLALAPADFGKFSGNLLIGNFGDGRINALRPTHGGWEEHGKLKGTNHRPISIDGLWGIGFGNGGGAGPTNTLFFAAGPDDETHGLFGSITAP